MQGHDKPEHPHIMLESGDLLLNEDGTWLYHEQYEEISRLRQEGDPYNFIQLEGREIGRASCRERV